jgi:hypothetical protein
MQKSIKVRLRKFYEEAENKVDNKKYPGGEK